MEVVWLIQEIETCYIICLLACINDNFIQTLLKLTDWISTTQKMRRYRLCVALTLTINFGLCWSQSDTIPPPEGATIDQLISKSLGGYETMANKLTIPGESVLAELDMYISRDQYEYLYSRKRKKRKAVASKIYRWPNAIVPFQFAGGAFVDKDIYMIKVAMREWEKYTCLLFKDRDSSDVNYVNFQDGLGCNSYLGMFGGRQPLNLERYGCRYKGLYLHEIGHAVGLIHEHQRPIRDGFIDIIYRNVQPAMAQWFDKYEADRIENFGVNYEYSSVMHYGITAFSQSGQQTIRAKAQFADKEQEIGKVYEKELSFTDIETVNMMYGCASHCDSSIRCEGGFVDQNCACICPDGTSDCQVGITKVDPGCTNEKNKDWECNILAKQGECERNPSKMETMCRRACGICTDSSFQEPAVSAFVCENYHKDIKCEKWKQNGDCIVNERWMRQNCKKSCNYCEQRSKPIGSNCLNSYSDDSNCKLWSLRGECIINPEWMPYNCQSSCRTCPTTSDDGNATGRTTPPPGKTTQMTRTTQRATRPTVRTTQQTTPVFKSNCNDKYPSAECVNLMRSYGNCSVHFMWMQANCMSTCKLCEGNTTDKTFANCVDENVYCDSWANSKHCEINPGYMLAKCRRSCGVCTAGRLEAAIKEVKTIERNSTSNGFSAASTLKYFRASLFIGFLIIII